MEPAVGRREHEADTMIINHGTKPQWSPPLRAGAPLPPLSVGISLSSRNGARRQTAGAHDAGYMIPQGFWQPQWSPPLHGGSTREPLVYARDWD
jgi:hypothetical protein